MENSKISTSRVAYIFLMALIFIGGTFAAAFINSILLDTFICIVAIDVVFVVVFALGLMKSRLNCILPQEHSASYLRTTMVVLICWIIVNVFFKVPGFLVPMMIIVAVLELAFDEALSLCLSLYFTIIYGLCLGISTNEFLAYSLICVLGCCIAPFFKEKDSVLMFFALLICFAANIVLPVIFYYFTYLEIDKQVFVYAFFEALFVSVIYGAAFPLFYQTAKVRDAEVYENLIAEDYSLVIDIERYSYYEFVHAKRVSNLSRMCAKEIGARESVAACGGFYYRLGKMEGEPEIDNAIKVASDHCFPRSVVSILAEYGGIIRKPSSRESAIVHMVDSIVTKIEALDNDTMSSSWNQNMVIYQTINELSQRGMYDESGLSMNQFLRVREKLATEDILA